MVTIYGSGTFYGSGAFYGGAESSANGIPQSLRFYRTSQSNVYVFYWTFLPAFITPSLATADFELELDTTPLFNSPNLVSFTSSTAINFQNGNVWKGFSVPVATRINAITQTWYARVRTVSGSFISDWSTTLVWTIPQSWQQQVAEGLMKSLPDAHVYGKGDLLLPVDDRNTNLWVVEDMYGNQFDAAYYENFLTQTDNFISLVRDEFLYQNFGVLFNFPKSNLQQFVEYRETLRQLILGSLNGSTVAPIYDVIQTFTGVPPVIQDIRDLKDFFLNYIEEIPLNWINNLINASFETWDNGTSFPIGAGGFQITEGWFYSPFVGVPSGTISRNNISVTNGSFSLSYVQTNGSASGYVLQPLDPSKFLGATLTLSVDVKTSSSNISVAINDGGIVFSAPHPGDGLFHTLTVTKVITENASFLDIYCLIQTAIGTANVIIDNAILRKELEPNTGNNFQVSYEFTPASMNVFKNYIKLVPNVDFTEDEAIPGFILTTPPASTDSLISFYKIGAKTDPTPVLPSIPFNLLPNGDFELWSTGTSFINPSVGSFTADDWAISYDGIPTITVTRESSTVNTGTYSMKMVVNTVGGASTIQILNNDFADPTVFRGKTVSVSVAINSNVSGCVIRIQDEFGDVDSAPYIANTGWQTLTATKTISEETNIFQIQIGYIGSPVVGTTYIDSGQLFYSDQAVFLNGLITYTNGSSVVTGTNTNFSSQVSSGNILADGKGYYATVSSVNSNTSITLLNPWGGPTETVSGLRTTYNIPPLVLWDKGTLAFGIIVSIPNPGGFILDLALIESLVNPLLPAYTKVFYQIVS